MSDQPSDDELDDKARARLPLRENTRPAVGTLLYEQTTDEEFDPEESIIFLERLGDGWGEMEAGLSDPLGWPPRKIERFKRQPHIAELLMAIREMEHESVERAIRETAKRGNAASQRLWAYAKMGHRGWVDRKVHQIEGGAVVELVASVKQAISESTHELVAAHDEAGIRMLQQSLNLEDEHDDSDGEIVDAEILEL